MPRSRSQSNDSDRPSPGGFSSLASPPAFVNPPPAYIAPSAASQIVTNDHDTLQSEWLDDAIEPSGETAYVSPGSLKLVNAFLDQLLYNFLSIARSTSLVSLRPAVTEVLKPKLAKDAISGADQELHEYLGGQDDDELFNPQPSHEPAGLWDLERVWMRTRLRCMVYSSLGDMEEEDEDRYMEQESLGNPASQHHLMSSPGYVSPAVAIFLTSILEYIGEQALAIAGQAAYHRIQNRMQDQEQPSTDGIAERVVVEERDTEKVAFNVTLGRLWRTWRKRLRTPTGSISRSHPYPYPTSSIASASRRSSMTTIEAPTFSRGHSRNASLAEVPEEEIAANIPLPMSEDDVEEIEMPGFWDLRHSQDEAKEVGVSEGHARHQSLINFPSAGQTTGPMEGNTLLTYEDMFYLPITGRRRAYSLPAPGALPLVIPSQELPHDDPDTNLAPTDAEMEANTTQDNVACSSEPSQASDVEVSQEDGKLPAATILATAATFGAAAIVGVAASARGEAPATSLHPDDIDHPDDDDYEEPQVMEFRRVSLVEGTGSPAIVETRSRDTSSTRSLSLRHRAPDESPRDLEGAVTDPGAIGVARSSNSLNDSKTDLLSHTKGSDDEGADEERTGEQITKEKQKASRFVLGAPPTPRNGRKQEMIMSGEDFRSSGSLPRSSGPEHGAPPLTPLREMVEAAPDTSDEASIAPSQDATLPDPNAPTTAIANGYSPKRAASTSSSNYSHSRQVSVASSRISERLQHVAPERATVQRVYTPPQTPRDETPTSSPTPKGRRSESFGKSHRPIHTSGSATSHKLKGLMGWDGDKQSGQRKSDDEGSVKAQSFEQLIRSDETIQYTLTPENVREIDPPRPSTQRSTVSVTRLNGMRGNHSSDMSISSATYSKPRPYVPVSRPPTSSTVGRSMNALPRDARTESESLRDFAEFIRSTGPDQLLNSGYGVTPTRQAPTSSPTQKGGPISPSGLHPIVSKRVGSIASSKMSGRTRLQARDASVPVGNTSSDLIDFIRQGPPDHDSQNPRIPRTVAPFRNTMDSDRIYVLDPKAPEIAQTPSNSSLYDSKAQSSQSTKSYTSYSSQSGLLNKNHASNNRPQFDEPPKPQRKQRRVRDPYAIDSDDEDDEDLMPTPKPRREEESLIDFLNNVPPPAAAQVTTSVFSDIPKPGAKTVQKKSSAPTLMNRFGRTTSQTADSPTTSSPPASVRSPTGAPQLTLGRVGRSDSPLMSGTSILGSVGNGSGRNPPSTSGSSRPTYISHMSLGREPQRMNSKGSGSYMPRGGRSETTRTTTSDLADFLKNSGPPVTTSTYSPPPPPKVESGLSMAKLFRKKKTVAYA